MGRYLIVPMGLLGDDDGLVMGQVDEGKSAVIYVRLNGFVGMAACRTVGGPLILRFTQR